MTLREGYALLGGDWTDALARLGDRGLLVKHLRQFPSDDALQKLRAAVAKQEHDAAWRAAHTLRGLCRTLGLDRLARAAAEFMNAIDSPERAAALAFLEREHAHAVAVIGLMAESETRLAMALHELRTPLQTILGTAETHSGAEGMARIAGAAKHLLALLSDVGEDRRLREEPVMLRTVLREAAELVRGAEDHEIILEANLRHERILGDAPRLTQVLINLLTNAARSSTPSGAITLRATETDSGLSLSVEDHGTGMSEEAIRKAFVPYWREGSGQGMGLGLVIARELTERMGGTIAIDSAPGEGTTVTLRLPVVPSDAVESGAERVEKPRRFDGLRALLAEDDRVNAEVSAELLAGLGLRTRVARNGGEAARLARDGNFDCVFLDAHMPGMDQAAMMAAIRRCLPDAPIFALTAGWLPGEEDRLRSAGWQACLLKPVGLDKLSRLLSAYFPDW